MCLKTSYFNLPTFPGCPATPQASSFSQYQREPAGAAGGGGGGGYQAGGGGGGAEMASVLGAGMDAPEI